MMRAYALSPAFRELQSTSQLTDLFVSLWAGLALHDHIHPHNPIYARRLNLRRLMYQVMLDVLTGELVSSFSESTEYLIESL